MDHSSVAVAATSAKLPSVRRSRFQSLAPRQERTGAGLAFLFDARATALRVVPNRDDAVEALAHRFDVRDEDDLLEPILQPPEQIHHIVPAGLVQRSEDLV